MFYKIECRDGAAQLGKLIYPVIKRGHSNAMETSHDIFIRFWSKDISLERLHCHLSTNLALLQPNLTYMHGRIGIGYHCIPELYHRMKIPVFDGVQEALARDNLDRKKRIARDHPSKEKDNRADEEECP